MFQVYMYTCTCYWIEGYTCMRAHVCIVSAGPVHMCAMLVQDLYIHMCALLVQDLYIHVHMCALLVQDLYICVHVTILCCNGVRWGGNGLGMRTNMVNPPSESHMPACT